MKNIIIKSFLLSLPLILSFTTINYDKYSTYHHHNLTSPIEHISNISVDSILNNLSLKEKIGQLFMLAVYTDKYNNVNRIKQTINKYNIGGILIMNGSPYKVANSINKLQKGLNIPLMVAVDGEWGIAMRIDSISPFPKAMALGAISNDRLVYNAGYEVAIQCKKLGAHINFAPVADVNNNYKNPIINIRSFGNDPKNVARKSLAFAQGMQDAGILAVTKHFPGHGSTFKDSHKDLPVVFTSKNKLLYNDIYPFQHLINNEIGGIMVAHIAYPTLTGNTQKPASLSAKIIDSLLIKKMGFKGLIFSDALNMQGVLKNHIPGEIEVKALQAGIDVLLSPKDVETSINAITQAVHSGKLSEELINNKCRKVLKAKLWFGLYDYTPTPTNNLLPRIENINSKKIIQELTEASITIIKNDNNLLPFKHLEHKKILCIELNSKKNTAFTEYLKKYSNIDFIHVGKYISPELFSNITDTTTYYTDIIISQHGVSEWSADNFGLSSDNIRLAEAIAKNNRTTLVLFGNPYSLKLYSKIDLFNTILSAYSNNYLAQKFSAQAIFGGIGISGQLPVTINDKYKSGTGYCYKACRLKYTSPYELRLSDTSFYKVDSIALHAIETGATPGCRILYAKNGKIIYDKCFGYHTYKKNTPVKPDDLYDLASVTKVTATTISLMKLYDENKINLSSKLSSYLPQFKNTNKSRVRINQILAHQSGLIQWIPFYRNTLTPELELRKDIYSKDSSKIFPIKVAPHMYMRYDYIDTIFQVIIDTPLYRQKKYRYSDLGFYIMPQLIKNISGLRIDKFADSVFYKPLGMYNTCYNPWRYHDKTTIPTEKDNYFRHCIINGYVNDQGAAMLGGISGHAGLFSTADDLAKLGQLLLNKGHYGCNQYFKPSTLDVFNKSYFKWRGNRRGLGFDKQVLHRGDPGPTCESASRESFGHQGFTGTYFWIEPENNSIYIFLSNRTYPDPENKKLAKENIRTDIQQVFYDIFSN